MQFVCDLQKRMMALEETRRAVRRRGVAGQGHVIASAADPAIAREAGAVVPETDADQGRGRSRKTQTCLWSHPLEMEGPTLILLLKVSVNDIKA